MLRRADVTDIDASFMSLRLHFTPDMTPAYRRRDYLRAIILFFMLIYFFFSCLMLSIFHFSLRASHAVAMR